MDAITPGPDRAQSPDPGHSKDSSLREKILEHVLMGELLRVLWKTGRREIEVLRAEVDRGGYDLVLEANGVVRYIQLKSSYLGATTAEVDINMRLARKPGGCVLWLQFDPQTLELGPFLWYGGRPGEKLPLLGDRVSCHSKGDSLGKKSPRPNLRVLTKGKFTVLRSIEDVVQSLFGESTT